ncbi:hypothetical protein HY612_02900, partial [Candidatus Roizmanbacteria bacterium]|nr:hypothetical protein [Candidatus Roizmanbacteria bacterium]
MLNQTKKIFIVGIKGVAMTNLALILKKMGKKVSGSDVKEEFITDSLLQKNMIPFQEGFDPRDLPKETSLVIYSSGHQGQNNPQVLAAKKRKIKTTTQAEFLAELLKQFKTKIAVCGCHGKTTTSSLLAYALLKLGASPSYMVGSSSFNSYPGGDYKANDYFVVEADEYGVNPPYDITPKFSLLKPDSILCTNIDFDHPDVYKNIEEVKFAFLKFFQKFRVDSKKNYHLDTIVSRWSKSPLIFCADNKSLMSLARKLPRASYLTYGYNSSSDLKIINIGINENGSSFMLQLKNQRHSGLSRIDSVAIQLGPRMTIKLFGEKNISNAAGVILTLLQVGFSAEKIKEAIKDFKGAKRRFEQAYVKNDTFLFDDYAHH